jgi:hypothetical protein
MPLHGYIKTLGGAMDLKLSHITHDTVSKETVLTFADIFEPHPSVTLTIKVITKPEHTEAEIEALVKSHAREVLQAAISRCA